MKFNLKVKNWERVKAFFDRKRDFTELLGDTIEELYRYAQAITHVATGAWRKAHTTSVSKNKAELFIDPSARNPKSGTDVSVYAEVWEHRGGEMAVYKRTLSVLNMDVLENKIVAEVVL